MKKLSGCLTARLADGNETYDERLITEINTRIKPPRPIEEKDVYIRAMYIASDQINSQGGRFAEDELGRLAELLVDSPVMIGHQRDSLPVARNFMAMKTANDGRIWIKAYFYWMRDGEGADDLRRNIDGGIYKECSVSFLFSIPECSICGKDIRQCRHIPFQEYDGVSGHKEIAHFIYRDLIKVLETSLVFRGAVPGTRITDSLFAADRVSQDNTETAICFTKPMTDDAETESVCRYGDAGIVICRRSDFIPEQAANHIYFRPYQPGLVIRVRCHGGAVHLESTNLLPEAARAHLVGLLESTRGSDYVVDALLYAVRGRDRLDGRGLVRLLETGTHLHRLRLKICDVVTLGENDLAEETYESRLEQARKIFSSEDDAGVSVAVCRRCGPDEWKSLSTSENLRYNFGLEVMLESVSRRLTRYILTDTPITPAVIKEVPSCRKAHLICRVHLLDSGKQVMDVICPRRPELEQGHILLLENRGTVSASRGSWRLKDILPGDVAHQTEAVSGTGPDTEMAMYLIAERKHLRVVFRDGRQWALVTVHHFAPRLFHRGRRFIADKVTLSDISRLPAAVKKIPLRAITRTGGMIIIHLEDCAGLFGKSERIWMRPVLLDGEERYLFYGRAANYLPGEV